MTENMVSVTKMKVAITAPTASAARASKTATTMVIPKRETLALLTSGRAKLGSFFLPVMASVRISQMNDDFKCFKENQPFLASALFLILNLIFIQCFKEKERTRVENVHFIHDCCPLQQVAMAEKVSPCSIEVWRLSVNLRGKVCVWGGIKSLQLLNEHPKTARLRTYRADAEQNRQVCKETDEVENFRCRANHHIWKYSSE